MSTSKSIFLIGPGLIGWSVIDTLSAAGYEHITTLVRRKEHGEQIQKVSGQNIKIVLGDLNDSEKITAETEKADAVIHNATADHLPSVKAVLEGLKRRSEKGLESIYLHTSGTSVLADKSISAFKSDKVYSDNDPKAIDDLDPKQFHRDVDLEIVGFSRNLKDDKTKIAIMIPPLIYGYNANHDRLTIQVPTLARFAIKNGYSGHIGKGLGVIGGIHVNDLARAYLTLLKHLEDPATATSSLRTNPYFFVDDGKEYSWLEAAEHVGKSLKEVGQLDSAEPKEIPRENWDFFAGDLTPPIWGMNARSKGDRLRALGWEPKEKGLWESWYEDELPALLRHDGKDKK